MTGGGPGQKERKQRTKKKKKERKKADVSGRIQWAEGRMRALSRLAGGLRDLGDKRFVIDNLKSSK